MSEKEFLSDITKENIEQAINEIDLEGIRKGRHSSTYDLVYNGKRYPPKLVLSLANKYANGNELDPGLFGGGQGTPAFDLLQEKGFVVALKNDTEEILNDVKGEFANWLLKHAPISYNQYLGSEPRDVIERLDEINKFFPERDLFKTNNAGYTGLIKYILFKTNSKERIKNPDFVNYDKFHSNGIPKAVIGKNNYVKFLNEKFGSTVVEKVSYWIFQGNPNIYNITDALHGNHLKSWKVATHKDKIKPGDKVIIWQTGEQAGCYALAEVISEVSVLKEEEFELEHYILKDEKENTGNTERVKLRIVNNLAENPILWSSMKNKPEFSNFKAGNQGTNFNATQIEYNTLLEMAETTRFSWVKTYSEIVDFLKDNEDDQIGLINILKDAGCEIFNDQDPEENIIGLEVIDPFTFFCYINKYFKQRLDILQNVAEILDINVPSDDAGIPSANPQKVWLFPYKYLRKNDEIKRLWSFFFAILNDSVTNVQFEDILQIKGVAHAKLTESMFCINPEKYFPINGPTKPFLKQKFGINPKFNTYTEYLDILAQIKAITNTPFYELSYEARFWNDNESDFKKVKKQLDITKYEMFITALKSIVAKFNLDRHDKNLAFNVRPEKSRLVFIIGSRYVFNIQYEKKKTTFGVTTDKVLSEENGEFRNHNGEIEAYWSALEDISGFEEDIMRGCEIELNRDNKSPYRGHTNEDFMDVVFGEQKSVKEKDTNTNNMNFALNTILYGPPGTGKTYATRELAVNIAEPGFEVNTSSSVKGQRDQINKKYKELFEAGQIVFTTFHQSMSYEDFVEGIKPETIDKNVTYDTIPGVFKEFCEKAGTKSASNFEEVLNQFKSDLSEKESIKINNGSIEFEVFYRGGKTFKINPKDSKNINPQYPASIENILKSYKGEEDEGMYNPTYVRGILAYLHLQYKLKPYNVLASGNEKNFVLIIDEINRGNVSAIFGELITLLEPDKRLGESEALKVKLPYSKSMFGVPPNVYIIGTMNTADRSVEALDTALRRRFSFNEVMPNPKLLRGIQYDGFDLDHVLTTINSRIEVLLDRDHTIGHSYFMNLKNGDTKGLLFVFKNKIIPLLQEYFYQDYEKIALVLGEGFIRLSEVQKVRFANFNGIEAPEGNRQFELIEPIEDIESAIKLLLNGNA